MRPVVLTVPHGCPKAICGNNHEGDFLAPQIAWELYQKLTKEEIQCYLFMNPISREYCDMNRPESRNTPFRNSIIQTLFRYPNSILIDIHSYPPTGKWSKWDIILLKSWGYSSPYIIEKFKNMLKQTGLKVAVREAHEQNDIVISATMLGHDSILIEGNEKFKNRIHALSTPITNVVTELVKS